MKHINSRFKIKDKVTEKFDIYNDELVNILTYLHDMLNGRRHELLSNRAKKQDLFDSGELPSYLDKNSPAVSGNWQIATLPKDLLKRRVEITGPVSDTKMVINMLNRTPAGARADTAMLDFEDSMCPTWENVLSGIQNVRGAAKGNLEITGNNKKQYKLIKEDMAGLMVRLRGLHMQEHNICIDDEPISAGLHDLVVCFYHTWKDLTKQGKTPKYYIPKCENHLEARWWNSLFNEVELLVGCAKGTLRTTFLIETLTAAFEVEEILFELRNYITGFNVGRWDKIFSDIKVLGKHPDRISSDRDTITMKKHWMENYAKRIIKICHNRGAMAIGGMSACTPGADEETRKIQSKKVRQDKLNEAKLGHDGCWVSHPYFIDMAMKQFSRKNQLDILLTEFDKYPELLMDGKGPKTLEGLRKNIRVAIAYVHGWKNGKGCIAWENSMEDLATLEISRAQVWQWHYHRAVLDCGSQVTKDLIKKTFDEEVVSVFEVLNKGAKNIKQTDLYDELMSAKENAKTIFTRMELDSFFQL